MTRKHLKSMMAFALMVVITTAGAVSTTGTGKDAANGNGIIIYSDLPDRHGD